MATSLRKRRTSLLSSAAFAVTVLSVAGVGTTVPLNGALAQGATCGTFAAGAIVQPAQGDTGGIATNTACGAGATAINGTNNTAIGAGAVANANDGTGLGRATAVGQSIASGLEASAFGFGNTAQGDFSTALGAGNTSLGLRSTTVGALNTATGAHSIAMGVGSTASGDLSLAIGNVAGATALNSTALGSNSLATAVNSVAIGAGSIATQANTVSVGVPGGERRITNVAAGINPTDAVNVSQLNGLSNQLNAVALGLQTQITDLRTETRRGIASALAANSFTTPIRRGGTTVGVTGGFFQGESAVGVNVAHRVYAVPNLVVYGSYGTGGGGNTNSGKVGASYEF